MCQPSLDLCALENVVPRISLSWAAGQKQKNNFQGTFVKISGPRKFSVPKTRRLFWRLVVNGTIGQDHLNSWINVYFQHVIYPPTRNRWKNEKRKMKMKSILLQASVYRCVLKWWQQLLCPYHIPLSPLISSQPCSTAANILHALQS